MMDYIKRRFSSADVCSESTDDDLTLVKLPVTSMNLIARSSAPASEFISHKDVFNPTRSIVHQQTTLGSLSSSSPSMTNEKSKLLLIIDDQHLDWRKYFNERKLFADYNIHVEQAEFHEINLSAHSNDGLLIHIDVYRNGIHIVRSFRPDFVLVRQYVKDANVDWIKIILGMQYGAVPSVNSIRALYNFRDKPWVFAELLKIQRRLGAERFPLINQAYYPNYRKMFISPPYPSVVKIGQAHQGLGKIIIRNVGDYHDLTSIIEMSQCYSTIEPYLHGKCTIYLQKIGHHYKAFRRKSSSDNWKGSIDSVVIKPIELTERYRLWLDEVSQIFGGLDLCALEIIQMNNGKELIIDINDSTMKLIDETQEEDCQLIAELIIHRMEIHCRPNQQRTTLTRISSFDELPNLPEKYQLNNCSNEHTRQTTNSTHTDDTFSNLKKAFSDFFDHIIS